MCALHSQKWGTEVIGSSSHFIFLQKDLFSFYGLVILSCHICKIMSSFFHTVMPTYLAIKVVDGLVYHIIVHGRPRAESCSSH